jgi:asparagine synthase (glutamine-hydrolysing)
MLPTEIVWRGKEQFDEGSGIAGLMSGQTTDQSATLKCDSAHSPEQAYYRDLLVQNFDDPQPVLNLVAHWAERPAA